MGGGVSVTGAFTALVATLDSRTAEADVLVEAGHALALEIDTAQLADDKGKTKSASAAVTALRGLVDDLIAKGRVDAGSHEAEADWSDPSVADLAKVRDAKEPGTRNARSRSGRGGATAS